jgi:RNA polymerase sigma factor for flagellar operon FliA
MYDRLRAADWVPRSLRIRSKKIEAAMFDLEVDLGRKPTIEEISDFLDYDEEDTREAISLVLGSSIVGIDTPIQIDNQTQDMNFSDIISDRNSDTSINHEYDELLEMFANFMSNLAQREKVIVVLYYCENKTLQQIGDILGVTESRVCQIHNKTLSDLRKSCLLD